MKFNKYVVSVVHYCFETPINHSFTIYPNYRVIQHKLEDETKLLLCLFHAS